MLSCASLYLEVSSDNKGFVWPWLVILYSGELRSLFWKVNHDFSKSTLDGYSEGYSLKRIGVLGTSSVSHNSQGRVEIFS